MFKKFKNFNYYIKFPKNYDDKKSYNLLFDIHGAGRRGTDVTKMISGGLEKSLENNNIDVDCVVIAPQCFADCWFDIYEQLKEFIYAKVHEIKHNDVLLSGTSMGGYCAWQLLMSMPDIFDTRAVICCGGGMYWNCEKIKAEVKVFHGKLDQSVYPIEDELMVEAINYKGGKAELTIFDNLHHNVWDKVFSDKKILSWLCNGK